MSHILRRRVPLALAALLVLVAGCDRVERPLANATRFAARMSCSCVFVTGRDLPACVADLPSQAGWLDFELDPAARTVAASALWITSAAEFSEGRGCRLRD